MANRTTLIGLALLALGSSAGCGTTSMVSSCVPGATQACLCVGGAAGVQSCNAAGTYDSCVCTTVDAGTETGTDAGADAASMPADTGLDCPAPFVVCGGACIDPSSNAAFCGASGACDGSAAGEACGGACSMGLCVWDSCQAAQMAGHTLTGLYMIDPDGSGPIAASRGYCDMDTAGGGWQLVYKVRNDIADIADPWWGMVDLGSGTEFPTTLDPVPAGSHFEGPTREVRHALYRHAIGDSYGEYRATVSSATGSVLLDVGIHEGHGAVPVFANGEPSTPAPGLQGSAAVIASSAGFPSAGSSGHERFSGCTSGTCDDADVLDLGAAVWPLLGDTSIQRTGSGTSVYAETTTLIWIRTCATNGIACVY